MIPYFTASQGKALEQKVDSKPVGSVVTADAQPVTGATTINSINIDGTNYNLPQPSSSEPVHIHWELGEGQDPMTVAVIENISEETFSAIKGKVSRIDLQLINGSDFVSVSDLLLINANNDYVSVISGGYYDSYSVPVRVSWQYSIFGETLRIQFEALGTIGDDYGYLAIDIYSM